MMLDRPLQLEVGERGVIGRRITIYNSPRRDTAIAEGIIGWN